MLVPRESLPLTAQRRPDAATPLASIAVASLTDGTSLSAGRFRTRGL